MIKALLKLALLAIVASAGASDAKKSWGMTTSSNSTSTAVAAATPAGGASII